MITIEWTVIIILIVAMYVIVNKYEKKMSRLEDMVEENRSKIENSHSKIRENHQKIKQNYNHIEKLWVTIPKASDSDEADN